MTAACGAWIRQRLLLLLLLLAWVPACSGDTSTPAPALLLLRCCLPAALAHTRGPSRLRARLPTSHNAGSAGVPFDSVADAQSRAAACSRQSRQALSDPGAAGSSHLPAKASALCQQMNRR
eukprot:COSAG01_NODE_3227_length_6384_cov_6.269690_4_plen_121_part_00